MITHGDGTASSGRWNDGYEIASGLHPEPSEGIGWGVAQAGSTGPLRETRPTAGGLATGVEEAGAHPS
jgi:hypothetical protein